MSALEFQGWLTKFAECFEKCGRSRVLVDSTTFRMSPANMDGPWRDANIIPRHNAAGVAKFAFHMPEGMPMIGKPPAPEGPGRFPTGYFARRHDALDWLATYRCAKQWYACRGHPGDARTGNQRLTR